MKNFFIIGIVLLMFSCSKEKIETYSNLKEYIATHNLDTNTDVIACAASDKKDSNITYVFFYPVPNATDIKYFEAVPSINDKNNFELYEEVDLQTELVFNGYLQRFVRTSSSETWCTVSYIVDGKLRIAQPIRLKYQMKPTEWTDSVEIDFTEALKPKFSWQDGDIKENAIYFQVITDSQNNLLSGTYTYDRWFQYYELSNVVLNVTRETPPSLVLNNSYSFTLMAVSLDNWVNLVVQKDFQIPNE